MDRILEELARHTDDSRPDVDVYLVSGPVLRGRVIAVQQGMATMHLGPAREASIAYVRVEHIVAITVLASARSASSLTPSKGIAANVEGPRPPSHHDDIITPVNEMSYAAMQAAMATPTPPEEMLQRQNERAQDRGSSEGIRRSSPEMRLEKARADKARAEKARAELARSEQARTDASRGDSRDDIVRGEIRSDGRRSDSDVRRGDASEARRGDDVSAAFSAMRVPTDSIPSPDPIAEFVASQYDVITPPDPIEPPSLHFGPPPGHIEAPTYLGERPQPRAKTPTPSGKSPTKAKASPAAVAAAAHAAAEPTFPMRGDTPKPRTPPPSRPELMRQANTHAEMMSRVVKHRIDIAIAAPLDDDARRAIGFALPIASDVLLAMFGEPKHRAAMDAIAQVELVVGDAEVVFDGPRLVIRCSLVDRFTPASLRVAIESALR